MDYYKLEKLSKDKYEAAIRSITPNSKWVDAEGVVFIVLSYEYGVVIFREELLNFNYSRSDSSFLHTFSLKGE